MPRYVGFIVAIIHRIINLSIGLGNQIWLPCPRLWYFSKRFKSVVAKPLLKTTVLDSANLKNYRVPFVLVVSQIPFLWNSTFICAKRYLCCSWRWSFYCSATPRFSEAFDIIDHNILIQCLQHWFGISSTIFYLLSFLLSYRFQTVSASNSKFNPLHYTMMSHKGACWNLFSIIYIPFHFILLYRNFVVFATTSTLRTSKIYLSFSPEQTFF